ncbi:MAG TPA: hypothetical protein VFU73_04615 [Actinocrinis sp.]|nr:hypothetical protein [Actinocrinis sp.]
MLIARSSPECRLYMDLHACSCGETGFEAGHVLREDPEGRLVAVYRGNCPRCGLPRQFTFALDEAVPPPPPAFGGPAASRIICPGEFLLVADQAASSVPLVPEHSIDPERAAHARIALATAVAAVEEVLKFIPEGASSVPEEAVTSQAGRTAYAREPGRFSRARLEATIAAHRAALAARIPA